MADKVDKPKKQKAKAKQDDKSVLASLPSTRPERIGTRRAAPAPKTTTETAASQAAAGKPAAKPARAQADGKPAPARAAGKPARAKAASKRTRAKAAGKPRATAARRKAAAPRTFEPTEAAEAAAGAADERAAGAVPRSETPPRPAEDRTYPRPRPVREGAPGIGSAGYRDETSSESGRPSGVELASTAVRAAGEVAQLGLTIGGRVLKRVVDRLPKP